MRISIEYVIIQWEEWMCHCVVYFVYHSCHHSRRITINESDKIMKLHFIRWSLAYTSLHKISLIRGIPRLNKKAQKTERKKQEHIRIQHPNIYQRIDCKITACNERDFFCFFFFVSSSSLLLYICACLLYFIYIVRSEPNESRLQGYAENEKCLKYFGRYLFAFFGQIFAINRNLLLWIPSWIVSVKFCIGMYNCTPIITF